MPRGTLTLRPVENRLTAHGARARWRTWRGCLRGQRAALHPTPLAEALLQRHRARSAAEVSVPHGHSVQIPCRAAPRAAPRGKPADCPRSTRALADLAWLSSRPMYDALHPTQLAKTSLHRHRARTEALRCAPRSYSFRTPCRAARTRVAPWRTGRQPTEHGRASGVGVVVFAANGPLSTPRRWPRLFCTDTAPDWRLRLRYLVATGF